MRASSREIGQILTFEASMICSYYPEYKQIEVEEALEKVKDPFFIMGLLSLLRF